MKYEQRYSGEWVDVTAGTWTACCSCGLVHEIDYLVIGERVLRRLTVNAKRTAAQRRRKEVKESIKRIYRKKRSKL